MDRVFDQTKIIDVCDDLNVIAEKVKTCVEDIGESAEEIRSAATTVPSATSTGMVGSRANECIDRASEVNFSAMKDRLSKCKNYVDLIMNYDDAYAGDTDALKAQINTVTSVLEEMQSFMRIHLVDVNPEQFSVSLVNKSSKWKNKLDDAQKTIDQIKSNIKGYENISSVYFSEDPVNLSTGNFVFERVDFNINGTPPFIFKRFYNAINDRRGSLGRDWNHNFEIRLLDEEKEKVLLLEEGKEERFLKTSVGSYVSLYQSDGTLAETEQGYCYQTREQSLYHFDKEGYCVQIETIDGSNTLLSYEEKDQGKQLVTVARTTVARTTGESFSLSYTEDGYLTQVCDHTGRKVTYEIKEDTLVKACTPKGHCFYYYYNADSKLEAIKNPRGIVTVENTYDDQQRTIQQVFPNKASMSFSYDDGNRAVTLTERDDEEVVYIHDEQYRDIKHIHRTWEESFSYDQDNQRTLAVDRLGNKTRYEYNDQKQLTQVINALGGTLQFSYDCGQVAEVAINGNAKLKGQYDAGGNLIQTVDALGNIYRMEYETKGRPGRIHYPDGSVVKLSYDERGNVTQFISPCTGNNQYFYDALNRVTRAVDGNGNEVCYAYDLEDNITCITNAKGHTRTFEYNESNCATRMIDFDGRETRQEYGVLNRPDKQINAAGQESLLTYDAMWNLARVTKPNGAQTTHIHNEYHQVERIYNHNRDTIRYEYDKANRCIQSTDEEGNDTFFAYDAIGQLTKVTNALGQETLYEHDGEGHITGIVDALGNKTSLSYDANGNLIKEVNPLGAKREYTYTPLGLLESLTDEAGRKVIYDYEPGGRLQTIRYPDKTTESYEYDPKGNVKTYRNRRGYTESYRYNSLDQMVQVESYGEKEERTVTKYEYNRLGKVTAITDGAGNRTTYQYTLTNQLSRVIDALGNKTEYQFDECDRLIEVRQYGEERCLTTRYEWDICDRLIATTDTLGQKETYQYNKKGELIEKIDKQGYSTTFDYTPYGKLQAIHYDDGREVKFSYNPLKQLQQIEDWTGITRIQPDAAGRATKVTYPDGREVSYTYGSFGECQSITYPDGKTVRYGYDEQLRLKELRDGEDNITYTYSPSGDLIHKQLPNGVETNYAYNLRGQLISLIHQDEQGILDSYRFDYDAIGNKTSVEKQRRGLNAENGSYTYRYDQMRRLTEVKKDGILTSAFSYDAFGNRLTKLEFDPHGNNEKTTYHYNSLNQLIKQVDANNETTYVHDKRGNIAQILQDGQSQNEYVYGAINRLEMATNSNGAMSRYTYNGLGHRMTKQMPTGQINYTLDMTRPFHNLLQSQETGEKNQVQTFLWDDNVASVQDKDDQNDYYLQDELGSPVRLMGNDGVTRESYGYDAFGQDIYPASEVPLQPFGYTGYQRDSIAQTYYAQAREYKPQIGRFTSEDLVNGYAWEPFTLNSYVYCWNRPLNYVDLDGKFPWDVILFGGLGKKLATKYPIPSKKKHYNRNVDNVSLPETFDELAKEKVLEYKENQTGEWIAWKEVSPKETKYHQIGPGNEHNKKYIHRDGREVVLDGDGNIVTGSINLGTYNYTVVNNSKDPFKKAKSYIGHGLQDVIPYWLWGNLPTDPKDPLSVFKRAIGKVPSGTGNVSFAEKAICYE